MQSPKLITKLNLLTLSEMAEWSMVVLLWPVVMSGNTGTRFPGLFSAGAGPQTVLQEQAQAVVPHRDRQTSKHKGSRRDPHFTPLPQEEKEEENISK